MKDKYSYYDFIAHLVPGTLMLVVLMILPPLLGLRIPINLPETAGVGVSLALAYALGQMTSAIASLLEPVYEFLWGGKPSVRVLSGASETFNPARRKRIVQALKEHSGVATEDDKSYRQMFGSAMALVNKGELGRAESFNASYAFHRSLLTSALLGTILLVSVSLAIAGGVVVAPEDVYRGLVFLVLLGTLACIIEFFRTKQRSYYYVREVLDMAFLAIQGTHASGSKEDK